MTSRMIFSIDIDYFPGSEKGTCILLEVLRTRGIKGTFFVTGKFAENYPEVIKKAHHEGHEIGCHGHSHGIDWTEKFVNLNLYDQVEKITLATRVLEKIVGIKIKIFRAPYLRANGKTIQALEYLEYDYDSSVASLRFDFGLGTSSNPRALVAPTKPYYPSTQNIFQRGRSRILEIPASNFIVPLNTTSLRIFGWEFLLRLYKLSLIFFNPVVIIAHPWEFMDVDELYMNDDLPKRHKKNRGKKCLALLQNFLDKIHRESEYVNFEQIVKEEMDG